MNLESRVPEQVQKELARRGHVVSLLPPFASLVGQGEAVMRDARRQVNFAGSDPRCDGAAIPQSPPVF